MFSPNFMKKFAKLTNIWCFSWSCVKRAAEPRGTLNLWCQIEDGFPREFPPPRAYYAGAAYPWARRFGVQLTDTQLRRSVREVGEILEGTRPRSGITALNAFFSERHFSTALTVYRETYTSNWHEQGHLLFGKPVAITWRSAFFNFRPASIFFSNISPILYLENMTFFQWSAILLLFTIFTFFDRHVIDACF